MRNTHQEEVMIFRFRSEIFEDRLLPVPLHVIPVLDLTMANGIVDAITRCLGIGKSFVSNEEVEVLNPALGGEMAGLRGYCRARTT